MSHFQFQKEPDKAYNDEIKIGDTFWPSLSLSEFEDTRRIPTEYDKGQQREALKRAINNVILQLTKWKEKQVKAGKTDISECGHLIDGEGAALGLFKSAVYDTAKATLLIHFKTVNRREEANNLAKEERSTYDELLREAQASIRGILEISSTSVLLL